MITERPESYTVTCFERKGHEDPELAVRMHEGVPIADDKGDAKAAAGTVNAALLLVQVVHRGRATTESN